MEHVLDQTAITYPATTVNEMSGEMIKAILEDVADNLFNPDRTCRGWRHGPRRRTVLLGRPDRIDGKRIGDMTLNGKAIEANRTTRSPAGVVQEASPASRSGTWWRSICASRRS